jgi:hypothetical protein
LARRKIDEGKRGFFLVNLEGKAERFLWMEGGEGLS